MLSAASFATRWAPSLRIGFLTFTEKGAGACVRPFVLVTAPEDKLVVTKSEILRRGLRNRCPNCGGKTLFARGLTMNERCSQCGMMFERGEGFFLGSMSINYIVTLFVYLLPVLILFLLGILSVRTATVLGIVGAILFPILVYRSSRSWWLMAYFYFLPHELPANRKNSFPFEDEA